jgi:tryptophan synthase beta chain
MHTLGHTFIPPSIHAGGLRYHGVAPIISRLLLDRLIEARSYKQLEVFEAAVMFARTEGIIPAPETAHAIKAAIDEALQAKKEGTKKTILFNFSGHGHFDMASYDAYFAGKLENHDMPKEEIVRALSELKTLPVPA